jgi:hypothetical protein
VKGFLIRLVVAALAATVAMALVLDLGAKRKELVVAIYLDVLFALLLLGLVAAARSVLPPARELNRARRLRTVHRRVPPQQLEWLERQVGDAQDSGFELLPQFRRVVQNIAAAALASKHGIVLERDPERSRALVSERVWQLIRPDDPATKLPPGGFRALVADLEAI